MFLNCAFEKSQIIGLPIPNRGLLPIITPLIKLSKEALTKITF